MLTCRGCKELLPEEAFARDRQRASGYRYKCRKCSSEEFRRWKNTEGYQRRLVKQKETRHELKRTDPVLRWAKMAVNASRARAKVAGLEHEITVEWLVSVAPQRCPLLGERLEYANTSMRPFSPAVDRIDNDKGYTLENSWVISSQANRIKTNATYEQIAKVARNLRKKVRGDKKG